MTPGHCVTVMSLDKGVLVEFRVVDDPRVDKYISWIPFLYVFILTVIVGVIAEFENGHIDLT